MVLLCTMDSLGQLPEHEVVVVNTFLEIKEKKRPGFSRAGTAPASAFSEETEVDEVAAVAEAEKAEVAEVVEVEQKPQKSIEEETEVNKAPAPKIPSVRKRPSLERYNTPDLWEQQQILQEVWETSQEGSMGPRLPSMDEESAEQQSLLAVQEPPVINFTPPAPAPAPAPQLPQTSQVAMLLVAPMVCQPVQVTPVGSPCAPSRQLLQEPEPPRLLGRTTSPRAATNAEAEGAGAKMEHQEGPLLPGALDQESTASGSERIRWCVDGQKLESHAEKLISPEFRLRVPGSTDSSPFRIMLLATQTGGKHGAGFKKAKGRGNIELKCLGSFEADLSMLVTVGSGSRKQKAKELVRHGFAEKSCCPLPKGGRDPFVWDLKAALCKETKCVEVCIEVLPSD